MVTRPDRLDQKEIAQAKWLLGLLLYLVALWAIAPVDATGGMLSSACALITGLFLLFPGLSSRVSRLVWNISAVVVLIWVVADFFMSAGDVIPPLVRMIAMLGLIRGLPPRRRREDLQLVLITLFMLVLAGVLTVSLEFAFQLLIFTPAAMVMLFVVTLGHGFEHKIPAETLWDDFSWPRLISKLRHAFDFRLLAVWGGLYALLLVASALIFVSLPRFRLDQALPFLRPQAQKSLSGFSETVTFGDVVDIIEDDSVALRVDVEGAEGSPLSEPYWRMIALDEYRSDGFQVSAAVKEAERPLRHAQPAVIGEGLGQPNNRWTFYLEGNTSRFLPLPGSMERLRVRAPDDVRVNQLTHVLGTNQISGSIYYYQAEGLRLTDRVPASEYEVSTFSEGMDPEVERSYPATTLGLPRSTKDKEVLRRLVDEISGGQEQDAVAFSRSVSMWLAQRDYSLSSRLPSGEGDPLVRWLMSDTPGHCEYFAGGFVLLMRAAGYPARVITGFSGGSWNGFENYFMVRNSNAHAWAEVFHEGEWLRVDPTPGAYVDGQGGERSPFIDQTFNAYLDSLRILWYRRIVDFDDRQQRELVGWLKLKSETFRAFVASHIKGALHSIRSWFDSPWQLSRWVGLLRNLLIACLVWILLRRLALRLSRGRSAHGGRVYRPERDRRRAGRLLEKIPEHAPVELSNDLKTIRYGHKSEWPQEPGRVFRRAQKAIRSGPPGVKGRNK